MSRAEGTAGSKERGELCVSSIHIVLNGLAQTLVPLTGDTSSNGNALP